jgi:large repetitive protein
LGLALPLAACQLLAGLGDPLSSPVPADAAPAPDGATPATDGATPRLDAGPDGSAYETAVLADGPVAYYRFDEASGAKVADKSGHGNDANLAGGFVRAKPAVIAGSDGVSVHLGDGAQMLIASKFDFDLTTDCTFEIWFRPDVDDAGGALFGNLTGTPGALTGVTLYLGTKVPYAAYERWNGLLVRYAHSEVPVSAGPGGIYHLVAVNRGGHSTLFLDGSRIDGNIVGATDAGYASRAIALGYWAGDYDELAIYDKALDDERIAEHYGLGRSE